jgi:tetratricopeptide (TPR) repeat protein
MADEQLPCDPYDAVFDRVFQRVASQEATVAKEREQGSELLEELLRHPPARQRLLVSNSSRFKSRMLCEHLLKESLAAAFQDVVRAGDMVGTAVTLADLLTAEDCGGEEALLGLRARAWAQLGNVFRIRADHHGAERAFETVDSLTESGPVSLLDKARVLDLKASLRRDQRRFDEAAQLLDQVISIYHQLGQWNLLGRSLKQKSMVCGEAGDLEAEIALLRCALQLLDPEEEPRSFLSARHNLIFALNESGRAREAFALLFHTRPLYLKQGDRMNLLRLRWLEGAVALKLGRIEQAGAAFREVRDAYLDLGLQYDAAVVSLDLAGVCALQGRPSEVRRLAEETLAIFQSLEVHCEAMAAFLAFYQAARQEKAEAGLVQEVASFLRGCGSTPALRVPQSNG